MASSDPLGPSYEAQHVHSVYQQIASHFSSTRYKPWPIVERFLKEQPDGAVGADVGCGNGKYLGVNRRVFIVGSDRSANLITLAKQLQQTQHSPHSTIIADTLCLPHPPGCFDFAISIAVIHHLSTPERRVGAVKSILDLLRRPDTKASSMVTPLDTKIDTRTLEKTKETKPANTMESTTTTGDQGTSGKALIYVWALEQKDSRRGWDEGDEQDVMVPWVLKEKKEKKGRENRDKKVGGDAVGKEVEGGEGGSNDVEGDKTYLRYYHLYKRGELEKDIEEAGGVVLESGYEKDNWWAVARRR